MKILMISGTFPPRRFGGVTAVSYNLAKRLVKRGHEVTIYTTDVGDDLHSRLNVQDTKSIDGIDVHYFRNISNSLAFNHRLFLPVAMFSAIRNGITNFDIIHTHDFRGVQEVITCHYAKKYNIPYVLQAHGSVLPIIQKQRLKKIFDLFFGYRILTGASKVIAVAKTEVEQYKKMGVIEDKIEIVPNGIDMSEYDILPKRGEFRKKYGISEDEKIVLYFGRINKIKGIDLLVRAFADLVKELDDVKLVVVGPDDGFLSALKRQIGDLKIGNKILFTGPLYERDKSEAYVDADVYVLPSIYEIFGITVLEACACGTPVIVTDRCGITDFVDGNAGCVVKYDNDKLRDAIFKILSDEGMRRRFGKEGKKLVREKFGWDNIVEKVEKIYLGLIER